MIALLAGLLLCASPEVRAQVPDDGGPMKDEDAGKPLAEAPLLAPPSREDAEERTTQLASQLRCPVCQGLSVGASPSEAARAMRDRIHELVTLGYSDEQIVDYFVVRYGTWVLLAPPKQGFTWLLWAGPGVGVAGGLVWLMARSRDRGAPPPPSTQAQAAPLNEDPYRARILAELGEGGRAEEKARS